MPETENTVIFGAGALAAGVYPDDMLIETLHDRDESAVAALIRSTMAGYEEAGSVIASTLRRLENMQSVYQAEGSRFFVLKDPHTDLRCIGGAGLGPLHGLPMSEGMGEVRDLILHPDYRGRGLGTRLLNRCLDHAKQLGYRRIYLESTPAMRDARRLFLRFGFRPVVQELETGSGASGASRIPCYFVLDDLQKYELIF